MNLSLHSCHNELVFEFRSGIFSLGISQRATELDNSDEINKNETLIWNA